MQLNWDDIRQTATGSIEELSTARGKNNLAFYLISRFIGVLVAVIAVESAVVWLESVTFLPLLQSVAADNADRSLETTSVVSLLQWAWTFLCSIVGSGGFPLLGFGTRTTAAVLVLAMLALLATPIVAGALVFATMVVRKVRALQEQREWELEQIEQQRSQFVTDIAHDLRTPLMAISGMAHALSDGLVRDEAQREEYLQSMRNKADKMGELVNAVFDYSKLGGGSFELNREVVDVSQLLLREAANAYTDAEEAGMWLTTCIPEQRCAVFADQVQLARVVANLIVNAVRHNPAGTEVAVILACQAGAAYVMVADSGVPIEGDGDDLFQPFAQGDAARSGNRVGSGLGLSICKRVADMHGFSLSVAQPYGRFTKAFVLQCPMCE